MVSRGKRPKSMLYMNQEVEEGEDYQLDLLWFRSRICHTPMWLLCNFPVCRISNPCKCQCRIQLRFLKIEFHNNNGNNNNKSRVRTRVQFNRGAHIITSTPRKKFSLFQ